jgi:hypothetical protein
MVEQKFKAWLRSQNWHVRAALPLEQAGSTASTAAPRLELLIAWYPKVIDSRFTETLEKQVTKNAQDGVKHMRHRLRFEHPMVETVENTGATADKRKRMDSVRSVVKVTAHLQNHALIDIQTPLRDLVHDGTLCSRVYDFQVADALSYAYGLAIAIADRALLVVDQ